MANFMNMMRLFLLGGAISIALLIVGMIGFTAIEMLRDWINAKNLSVDEKDSLKNFSKELSFYAKTAIGFGFVIMIGINPIIGFVLMTLAAIVLRASDVLLECSHYTFEQCMDMNQDIY